MTYKSNIDEQLLS